LLLLFLLLLQTQQNTALLSNFTGHALSIPAALPISLARQLCRNIPDRKVDIKDNQLGIKLIPMISTRDQVDQIFPVRLQV
jgi:hypothetical protein